jgi:hypothetical protein
MSVSEKLQTLIDDNKEQLTDGFYNEFCSLNKENYEKEHNNLYTIKYFTIKYIYSEYNVYHPRFVEQTQIISLTPKQVSYIKQNTKNGSSISTCCNLIIEDILPRLNCDLTLSVMPLQRSMCFCSNSEDEDAITPEDSISIKSFVRISHIEKY